MPVIIEDKRRRRYLKGLHEWGYDRSVLSEVVLEAQAQFEAQIELQKLRDHEHNFLPTGFTEATGDYFIPDLQIPEETAVS